MGYWLGPVPDFDKNMAILVRTDSARGTNTVILLFTPDDLAGSLFSKVFPDSIERQTRPVPVIFCVQFPSWYWLIMSKRVDPGYSGEMKSDVA